MRNAVKAALGHRLLPLWLALLAMALTAPSLRVGWLIDDHVHRAALLGVPELPWLERSFWDLFAFVGEGWTPDPAALPWWAPADLRLAFFRPLSGLTHALDYALWPARPVLMHAHSLLWLGAAVAAAGLFYRRILAAGAAGGAAVAGLATLAFAVDDAHAWPAIWIANRNSLISTFFGLLALIAFDRRRRDGWRGGAVAAPGFFLLALLAGEAAVACGAYLAAYALFLDRAPWRRRVLALAPSAAAGAFWWGLYKVLGFGAYASAVYVDPGAQPVRFAQAVLERAPVLLWGQWAFPPSDVYSFLSVPAGRLAWWAVLAALLLLAGLFAPLLRRDACARFFGLGMLLSLVPCCGTFPSDRLLFYPGLGAMGLLALFVADAWQRRPLDLRRRTARLVSVALLAIHLALAPFFLWGATGVLSEVGRSFETSAASLPDDPGVRRRQAVVVRTPSAFVTTYAVLIRALDGRPIPRETTVLATSLYGVEIERPDARTLVLRPDGGFLLPRGTAPPGREPPALSRHYLSPLLDSLFRDQDLPMALGESFERRRLRIEVTGLTADGRPAEVTFHFAADLDDESWIFLQWEQGRYVAWSPPPIGARTSLASLW